MDGKLSEEWLHELDRKLEMQRRKVVMTVDNYPAHPEVPGLKAINLHFLPPNTTSWEQLRNFLKTTSLGNNIPINGTLLLEELANFLTHLIATLPRNQTDDLEDGKRGTTRLPLYTFSHLKIHNKESGQNSEK